MAAEVIALTLRDDFLLDLSESLGGQASVKPVDSMAAALGSFGNTRRLHVLVIDGRDIGDLRAEVEQAIGQAPTASILVFAPAEAEKALAGAFSRSQVFAVLSIPIDRRKTAAMFEGALSDAAAKRSAYRSAEPPKAPEPRIETKAEPKYEPQPSLVAGPDEPPTPQISKAMWAGITLALIGAAGGGYWLFTKQESTPHAASSPSLKTQGARAPAADDSQAGEVPLVQGRADELLEKARLAMRERRYTEPPNDCALLYYRSTLAVDPGNGEARDGMARVANLLITRFEESMEANRYDEAAQALLSLKAAAPSDTRLASLESRLVQSQINRALSEGNLERAGTLVGKAQQANLLPAEQLTKWRNDIARRQDEVRVKRLVDLASDRLRGGQLMDPVDDSAKDYIDQLRDIPGTAGSVQRLTRDLNAAYLRKAREAQLTNRQPEADRWVAEARADGVSSTELAAYQRDIAAAKQKAASAEADRFAQLSRERIRDGRLTEPANDSAMYYLSQLNSADTTGSTGAAVGRELSAKLIDRASSAARDGRTTQVDTDLAAARRLGADPLDIQNVQQLAAASRNKPAATAAAAAAIQPRPAQQVSKLKRVRYAPPEYPAKAFQQKLTGSVTVEFVVDVNGEPRDARVVDSDPPEVFDKAALNAVKRWRYEPVVMNNVPTEVPTRMVIRFELPKE